MTGSRYHLDLTDATQPVLFFETGQPSDNSAFKRSAALFVLQDGKPSPISIETRTTRRHDTTFITPLSPLGEGLTFEWQIYADQDTIRKRFYTERVSRSGDKVPEIVSVYPQNTNLPSNILLFHLFFSEPMRQDAQAYNYVNIIDEKGQKIPFAWRQKASWADSGKQLVLMIHPGRIKQGINYATESGNLFEPGKYYTLQTDSGLLTLKGGISARIFRKKIHIIKPDRQSPGFSGKGNPQMIRTGSRQAVLIAFNEPMDYGSVGIGLYVLDKNGTRIPGTFKLSGDSTSLFTPGEAWQAGTYRVMYNEYLADLASNHIGRLFEVTDVKEIREQEFVAFSFRVE
jgi:hypothetical protein